MGKRYLIDSNAVIDFLGGKLPEKGKEMMLQIQPEISVITYIEMLSKRDMPVPEMQKYRAFANASRIYSEIENEIAERTIDLRKEHGMKTPDAIIAATAIVNGLTLITRNEKDFSKITQLNLVNPWTM